MPPPVWPTRVGSQRFGSPTVSLRQCGILVYNVLQNSDTSPCRFPFSVGAESEHGQVPSGPGAGSIPGTPNPAGRARRCPRCWTRQAEHTGPGGARRERTYHRFHRIFCGGRDLQWSLSPVPIWMAHTGFKPRTLALSTPWCDDLANSRVLIATRL